MKLTEKKQRWVPHDEVLPQSGGAGVTAFPGRPLGFGGTPAASFRCFRLYRERNPRISYMCPSVSPI